MNDIYAKGIISALESLKDVTARIADVAASLKAIEKKLDKIAAKAAK